MAVMVQRLSLPFVMLIPLTRNTFETLIPKVATGAQYIYVWGKLSDFLRRLLISVVGVALVIFFVGLFVGPDIGFFRFLLGIVIGLYWLWSPILWASLRNRDYRKYSYCGFWQGEVLDAYVSEELIGTEETVNERGDLVIVENRERCFCLEVGDETGFSTSLRVPLKRSYQAISPGDTAELLVLSNRGDLSRIAKTSDIYIPDHNIWVSDYPYLQRDNFVEVSRQMESRELADRDRPKRSRKSDNRYGGDRGGAIVPRSSRRKSSRRRPIGER
jgi:hypothetical protein